MDDELVGFAEREVWYLHPGGALATSTDERALMLCRE